ncbi:hypothetical protein GCM10009661_49020 [Catellatospora chokoriensis]|uniref:Uncharacterized protein n=1 Tax=Catellatospora chokoriensis TaxID=310353 RepID=A0A8J3NUH1_9ACTN|nr:hypothetical protein Cch02nite_63220 [Catellatospora chokoriensis]
MRGSVAVLRRDCWSEPKALTAYSTQSAPYMAVRGRGPNPTDTPAAAVNTAIPMITVHAYRCSCRPAEAAGVLDMGVHLSAQTLTSVVVVHHPGRAGGLPPRL